LHRRPQRRGSDGLHPRNVAVKQSSTMTIPMKDRRPVDVR
jgi:hypothetical protein